ncbi:hypothetical protein [Hymenobacter volaticus]|uniref:MerP protein n=1 Tax=Hymenobacter volaticus TaxID=2932254 RepID=A0ABY4G9G7_9BACT|nr:hypothetical protein [Hymenobacter volaticus]UOQ67502.1 hypothetical protein MUN86_06385 [Hymenobacter volaticus]
MKSVKTFLLALVTLLTTQVAQAQTTPKAKAKTAGTEQVQMKTSAVCDMCKTRLEKAMAYEKGVQAAVLDVPTQVLTVTYRPIRLHRRTYAPPCKKPVTTPTLSPPTPVPTTACPTAARKPTQYTLKRAANKVASSAACYS